MIDEYLIVARGGVKYRWEGISPEVFSFKCFSELAGLRPLLVNQENCDLILSFKGYFRYALVLYLFLLVPIVLEETFGVSYCSLGSIEREGFLLIHLEEQGLLIERVYFSALGVSKNQDSDLVL